MMGITGIVPWIDQIKLPRLSDLNNQARKLTLMNADFNPDATAGQR